METGKLLLAGLIMACSAAASHAQDEARPDRYQLEKTQNGFIRLDRQSGDVSFCREEQTGLICRMAADERKAFEQELDQLTRRVEALEKQATKTAPGLPSDEEVEKSLSIMERFFRRFMDIIGETRQDGGPPPDKT
ncbi:hypothetical protein ACFSE1_07460 [Rhizobium helianthi]|uniref:Uncharacterized protein n=1 Tax=Rhizobium helianthi TaxID=1132695 RepID=A0ABW4M3W1_9HYPH